MPRSSRNKLSACPPIPPPSPTPPVPLVPSVLSRRSAAGVAWEAKPLGAARRRSAKRKAEGRAERERASAITSASGLSRPPVVGRARWPTAPCCSPPPEGIQGWVPFVVLASCPLGPTCPIGPMRPTRPTRPPAPPPSRPSPYPPAPADPLKFQISNLRFPARSAVAAVCHTKKGDFSAFAISLGK